jgi:iron complex outermembrane recepter protein
VPRTTETALSAARTSFRTRACGFLCAPLFGLLALAPSVANAQITAPEPSEQPVAAWPQGQSSTHDVLVPVLLVLGATGEVRSAAVEGSLGPDFDAAALSAVRRWSFRPALHDGKPVAAKIRVLVRFLAQPPATISTTARAETTPPAATQESAPAAAVAAEPTTITVLGVRNAPPPRSASEVVQGKRVLASAPHRTAGDLLLTVPGIALTQHSGEGSAHQIFFRGFDAVHGQDLEIWAGGVPVNDVSNIHSQGYADLNFLPPEVVKQIRSAPGTYDPRQGDFSVAGTLWLDLGYDEPGVTLRASTGQFGTRRYFIAYHPKGWSDATFAAFELYSSDGFGPSRASQRTSAIAQTEVKVGTATARFLASTYAASFDSAGVLRLSDIESGRVERLGSYDQHQGGDSARSQIALELSQGDDESRWSLTPYAVLRSMRLRDDFTGYLVTPTNGTAAEVAAADKASAQGNSEQQVNDTTTVGMTGSYRRALPLLSTADAIEAGISARYDRISQAQKKLSIDTSQVTLDEVDAKINATDVAGYADLALHPIRRVTVRGGLRIDGLAYVTQDDGSGGLGARRSAQGAHLGKKGTVDLRITSDLHALASYGEGFRSPQARSLQAGETAPFTTVQSYELGVRYQTQNLRATASVFRTTLSDDLAFNQVTARNERTPPTRRTGVSVEMSAQPTTWFSAAASATYTRAEFTNTDGGFNAGDLLPYAPQVVIRSDVAFTPALGRVLNRPLTAHLGFGQTGIARRPLPYGEMGHDYSLIDAVGRVRLGEAELGLSAFNLLNLNWYDGEYTFASNFQRGSAPSLVPARHVTVGAPRSVLATLTLYL